MNENGVSQGLTGMCAAVYDIVKRGYGSCEVTRFARACAGSPHGTLVSLDLGVQGFGQRAGRQGEVRLLALDDKEVDVAIRGSFLNCMVAGRAQPGDHVLYGTWYVGPLDYGVEALLVPAHVVTALLACSPN